MLNTEKIISDITKWIIDFFEKNGKDCNAVIGISGGKDSSVAAALCVKALGRDRVLGVMLPNGVQSDIDSAKLLIDTLKIKALEINIESTYKGALSSLQNAKCINGAKMPELTSAAKVNLPPRLRMSTLYAVAQCFNGRVVNTCNLSEDWVGYSTRYGDSVGDFSPLSNFTVQEVKEIGTALGLPDIIVEKTPSDGLCGKSDEDNLGFTYAVLDRYIREGICEDKEIKALIDQKHRANLFKLSVMPSFPYNPETN